MCLATPQTDPQWSAFVFWIAQSLIYAEEQGIDQWYSNDMPLVFSFGTGLQRMFRDAVFAVGNYADLYNRHLSKILPCGGRNTLTIDDRQSGGPLHYIPPGFNFSS